MSGIELIRHLLEQSSAQGSKSTALNPMGWLIAILSPCLLGTFYLSAPTWASVAMGACVGISVAVYVGAYLYFMIMNPDALRSEKFSLSKMAIEKSLHGDNMTGLLPAQVRRVDTEPQEVIEVATEVRDGQ